MYNGIGLSTPRGSGTSGYVQKSSAFVSKDRQQRRYGDRMREVERSEAIFDREAKAAPDADILRHEMLRRVELQCLEFQMQLEEGKEALTEEVIEERVNVLRKRLTSEMETRGAADASRHGRYRAHEVHEQKVAKVKEMSRISRAFGMREDYVEGQAFDREFLEAAKEAKRAAWEEKKRLREEVEDREAREARRARRRRDSRSRSPVYHRSRRHRDSRSRSPSPDRSRRHRDSRSRSPIRDSRSRPPARNHSRSRSRSVEEREFHPERGDAMEVKADPSDKVE